MPVTTPDRESPQKKIVWRFKLSKLDSYKDRLSALQSLATILAILIGGIWTYRLFVSQRQGHPHLRVEHRVEHWKISDNQTLLSVDEVLTNSGSVLLKLRGGEIRVIQVVPAPATVQKGLAEVQKLHDGAERSIEDPNVWTVIAHAERKWKEHDLVIEPGENDVVNNEFVIPANVQVVAIFSYISNPAETSHQLGWKAITFYDLQAANKAASAGTAKSSVR